MNDKQQGEQPGGMGLDDIYYVLFRHKWKIILLSALGIGAAAALHYLQPPLYQSEAELYIRYISEGRSLSPSGLDPKTKSPDERGDTIISSEAEIIQSFDLAQRVATNVGAEKILAKLGGGKDLNPAASYIKKHIAIELLKHSSVIHVIFQHPDPDLVQPVLKAVIDTYFERHLEVHRSAGFLDEFITRQADEYRRQLVDTEADIKAKRSKVHVVSIEDAKRLDTEEVSKIKLSLLDLETEMAERQVALKALSNAPPAAAKGDTTTNAAPTTPAVPATTVARTTREEYERVSKRLDALWTQDADLRKKYTEESTPVKENLQQIAEAEKKKLKLEEEHPGLLASGVSVAKSGGSTPYSQMMDPAALAAAEAARILLLDAKIRYLHSELSAIQAEQLDIAAVEPELIDLQRTKQLQETNYHYFAVSKQQAQIDDALGAGKVTNISKVEEPTPPVQDWSKVNKISAIIAVSGIAAGLALAFLIELVLDRSVKRPKEIETKMGLRLFLSVPDISRNGHRRLAKGGAGGPLQLKAPDGEAASDDGGEPDEPERRVDVAPWDPNYALHPYYEALRDRLVGYFEVRNLTHKPKLVAVTGAHGNSGATTMAVGLAASLSETGDGNVLLVDMNLEHGAAHQFYKGKPGCGLDDALESKTRDSAMVQDNLYVVNGSNGDKLPRILPKRFANLLPKLKASDYDYIIFDMPPISQTSVTLRLSGFMDMVLLVVEAEKTNRAVVQRASALLAETKANVSVVLNKSHNYIPGLLHEEF